LVVLADTKVVDILAAAAAFVGVNEQCDDAVTPAITTKSEVVEVFVVREPTKEVLLSPSGSDNVLAAVTAPTIWVFLVASLPM